MEEWLKAQGLWFNAHNGGFDINTAAPYDEPEDTIETGFLTVEPNGTVVLEMEDDCGYGGPHKLVSETAFQTWWMDAMAEGFRELDWDSYEFVE
jgi:hypothetical protein